MTDWGAALSNAQGANLKITRLDKVDYSVNFPGYVTTFQDSYASNYNPTMVYGRMDPIMTFQNTQRKITIGFRVIGNSAISMIENQDRLRRLITMLYPRYAGSDRFHDQVMNSSPLVRVEYTNYIPDLVCAIDGLDYNPSFDTDQAWVDHENGIAPTYFDLSLGLTIIHEATMGFDAAAERDFFIPDNSEQSVDVIGYGQASESLKIYYDELYDALTPAGAAAEAAAAGDEADGTSRRQRRLRRRRANRAERKIDRANSRATRRWSREDARLDRANAAAADILTAPGRGTRTDAEAARMIAGWERGE